jgi:hypothetical protein
MGLLVKIDQQPEQETGAVPTLEKWENEVGQGRQHQIIVVEKIEVSARSCLDTHASLRMPPTSRRRPLAPAGGYSAFSKPSLCRS